MGKIFPQVPLEDAEQRMVFQWADLASAVYPELRLLYAIPNGGKRAIKTAVALKAQGVKAGVPDMCLPVPRSGYHGLYIELKRQKGGTVSDYQKNWINALTNQGYKARVCKGASEAMEAISEYLQGITKTSEGRLEYDRANISKPGHERL